MQKKHDTSNIEGILETVEEAGSDPDRVSLGEMLEEIGTDAFPAIMLLAALIMITPASGIPGLSTAGAIVIALTAVQMIVGRKALWLPGFLNRQTLKRSTLHKAHRFLDRPARFVDRLLGRRLVFLTRKPFSLIPAIACLAAAGVVPLLEFVPFSASIAATAIAFFALGLAAGDGLLVLVGMVVLAGASGFVFYMLQ